MKNDFEYSFKEGDGFIMLAVILWLSISVGPWWIGVMIIFVGWFINYLTKAKGE